MKTCRCILTDFSPGILKYSLVKNHLYCYNVNDPFLSGFDHIVYEIDTKKLVEIFTKKEFENSFIDTQVERKVN